jgi:hypothetical protein
MKPFHWLGILAALITWHLDALDAELMTRAANIPTTTAPIIDHPDQRQQPGYYHVEK